MILLSHVLEEAATAPVPRVGGRHNDDLGIEPGRGIAAVGGLSRIDHVVRGRVVHAGDVRPSGAFGVRVRDGRDPAAFGIWPGEKFVEPPALPERANVVHDLGLALEQHLDQQGGAGRLADPRCPDRGHPTGDAGRRVGRVDARLPERPRDLADHHVKRLSGFEIDHISHDGHPVAPLDRLGAVVCHDGSDKVSGHVRGAAVPRKEDPGSRLGRRVRHRLTSNRAAELPKVVRRTLEPVFALRDRQRFLIHAAAPHLEHLDRSDLDELEGVERSTSRAAAVPAIIAGDNGSNILLRQEAKVVNAGNSSPSKGSQKDRAVFVEAAHVLQHVPKGHLAYASVIS
jgi:hypothetical protein